MLTDILVRFQIIIHLFNRIMSSGTFPSKQEFNLELFGTGIVDL